LSLTFTTDGIFINGVALLAYRGGSRFQTLSYKEDDGVWRWSPQEVQGHSPWWGLRAKPL